MVCLTITLRPFQSLATFVMSSPAIFGDRSRGQILGARADVASTPQPVHLWYMTLISLGLNLGSWCWMNQDLGQQKKDAPWLPPS
ncbi:unnamed protein product [Gulo gulo]|uniref:Uncharacterized protein n=1 Tax=Gulo gulo TaxID=48420 RepID=A0A9X9MAH8_GULGU|nr:unnamed protein product [Gulo gulo]